MNEIKNNQLLQQFVEHYKLSEILSDKLLNALRLVEFKAGELIIVSNEKLQEIFFFVEGKAKVYYLLKNGKHFLARFYTPFEVIGDVELLNYNRYICSMKAITDVKCLALNADLIKKNVDKNTKFLVYLIQSLSGKLAQSNKVSAENLMFPLNQRLAAYLLAVANEDKNQERLIDQIYTDNLSELADLLGCSYRQLTRVIKQFKDTHIIEKKGKTFLIRNMDQLKSLAANIYD